MNIQMIVTDLDSTLLRSDKTISDYTLRILSLCKKQNIYIAFATARSEDSCKRFTDLIHPDAIVSNGGALARIGAKTVYRSMVSKETTNELLDLCLKHAEVGYITADTDKGYFVSKPVDESDPGWIDYLPARIIDFSRGLDCEAYKIIVEASDKATIYEIASQFPSLDMIPFSCESMYRFADKSADSG